jgi:alpha-ketoglutarate-dependent taurine dioxygenase
MSVRMMRRPVLQPLDDLGFSVGYAESPAVFETLLHQWTSASGGGAKHVSRHYAPLIPSSGRRSNRNTLTGRYGLSKFPYHIDGANLLNPPRYVALYCCESGFEAATTSILAWAEVFNESERTRLERCAVLVDQGASSFYTTLLSRHGSLLRWNNCVIRPTSSDAHDVVRGVARRLEASITATEIYWRQGMFVVFDNWRLLHKRGSAFLSQTRELARWWIREDLE